MIFDVNQAEFPTPRHKAIWDAGRQIVPVEVSLADISDPEMREGCTQIYNWTQEYFENMYYNPDQYSGYEPYGMFRLLDDVAENAAITDNGLIFTQNKYNQLLRLRKDYLPDLSLAGLDITDYFDNKILTNNQYPLFCKYFKLFYDAAFKKKVNRTDYLVYNDFRVLAPKYKRTFDDLLRALPDQLKRYAAELDEYARSKGAKLESPMYCCYFRYKYKKENLLILQKNNWRHTPLDIAVPYGLSAKTDSFATFMQAAESQPDSEGTIDYIQKEICKCDACGGRKKASERCSSMWKDIRGERRLLSLCHRDISKWKAPKSNLNYNDYDVKMLKRMIDIRLEQIDNLNN
jgi:hypothetical protein